MRCDRLLVGRANRRDLHERRSSPDRNIVHPFDREVTFPRSSVSAAAKWDIRRLAAQRWICRYRSNHRVGTCSQIDNNRGTLNRHREMPFRPEPHPNRLECHSSGPQFIIINRLIPTDIILRLASYTYNSHCGFRRRAGCAVSGS